MLTKTATVATATEAKLGHLGTLTWETYYNPCPLAWKGLELFAQYLFFFYVGLVFNCFVELRSLGNFIKKILVILVVDISILWMPLILVNC